MQTNICQMKTNFAKFQAEQFEKRNKVAPVIEKDSVDVVEEVNVAEDPKESKKKSFFGKKK